jgi:hypothetical protein
MVPVTAFPDAPGEPTPQATAVEMGNADVVVTRLLNCTGCPTCRSRAVGFTATLMGGALTVTVVDTDMDVSAALVAVTVTVSGLGGYSGAVYSPAFEIVPTVELPPATPLTVQVTSVLVAPRMVAVNCCVPLTCKEGGVTFKASEMLMATEVEADLAVSAWLVAIMVTLAGLGIIAGAVYMPELDIVPTVELPPVTPPTDHVTAVFVEFATVAENWKVCPTVTDEGAVPSVIVTVAGVVCVVVAGLEWQPVITTSRLRPMPRIEAVRRNSQIIEPTPSKPTFRFESYDIKESSACKALPPLSPLAAVRQSACDQDRLHRVGERSPKAHDQGATALTAHRPLIGGPTHVRE